MNQQLNRNLTVGQGLALAVSTVMGSGLLGLPGLALDAGGIDGSILGWIVTAMVSVPLIYVFCQLGLYYSSSAGLTKYAEAAAGQGARLGATMILVLTFVICIPVGTLMGVAYSKRIFVLGDSADVWACLMILGLSTVFNLLGIGLTSAINAVVVALLILLVAVISLTNPTYTYAGLQATVALFQYGSSSSVDEIWNVCTLLFWAFLGWENLSFGLEEFKNPRRSIPVVYWASFLLVLALYFCLALTAIGAAVVGVPITGASGLSVLIDGRWGTILQAILLMVVVANVNAWVYGASRLVFATARDGMLPTGLARTSKNGTPTTSLIVLLACYTVVIGLFFTCNLRLSTLVALVSQNFVVLYLYSIVAYWRLCRGVLGFVVTILATASCCFMLSGCGVYLAIPLGLSTLGFAASARHR